MSTNRSVAGISAPRSPALLNCRMQFVQMAGLPGKRPNPRWRRTAPPAPANGAAHSLQRGDAGTCRRRSRNIVSPGCSPVRTARRSSSGCGADMARIYARRHRIVSLAVTTSNDLLDPRGPSMRRGLSPDALGDLFDLPLSAVLSLAKPDGTVFSRPVWHRWEAGRFTIQLPAGDRKIAMLERDSRLTLLLAEQAWPYRGIEVRGRARMSSRAVPRRRARDLPTVRRGLRPAHARGGLSELGARHDRRDRAGRHALLGLR